MKNWRSVRFGLAAAGLAILLLPRCGSPSVDRGAPPVFINHFLRVLDADTYQAIADSEFLRDELCALQLNSASDGKTNLGGADLFGEKVYLEFFPEDPSVRRLAGQSGIAFGVEQPGGADYLFNQIVFQINTNVKHRLRTRVLEGGETPWFYETSLDYQEPVPLLVTWIMEYHPDYLPARYPGLAAGEGGITRERYLARSYDSSRLFKGVSEAVFALGHVEAERLIEELTVYGWGVERDKLETRCQGPETLIRIVPLNEQTRGLVSLSLELNRVYEGPSSHPFGGRSRLTFGEDATARWEFR